MLHNKEKHETISRRQRGSSRIFWPANKMTPYLSIARIDHWFKNIFMLPGLFLAIATGAPLNAGALWRIPLGIFAVCLIVSANYTINEWLDREFDKFHPKKTYRVSVIGRIDGQLVFAQWAALAAVGLSLSWLIRP